VLDAVTTPGFVGKRKALIHWKYGKGNGVGSGGGGCMVRIEELAMLSGR